MNKIYQCTAKMQHFNMQNLQILKLKIFCCTRLIAFNLKVLTIKPRDRDLMAKIYKSKT